MMMQEISKQMGADKNKEQEKQAVTVSCYKPRY